VNVVVQKTAGRESRVFENRDIRAMVDSPHLLGVIKARRQLQESNRE
jgi:hypothetical protein